ncbi:MAG: FG-GAP-like repeat-containing protein [Bacteroidota bacterium]|nr:FG-GAP-like repeat-containing protein [Bacteroidota bacterium]
MAYNVIRLGVVIFFFQILQAQNFVFSPHKFGNNLFAGGIDNPRFQFIDIDSDKDYDLFILDRDEQFSFYRNVNSQLLLEPATNFGLSIGSWFHFADIDNDGDLDCLTNLTSNEVSIYSNMGTASSPQFNLTTAALTDTSGTELYSERPSIPTFADIDGDGDLDFFSGSSNGSISFYKNIGNSSSSKFVYITNTFEGISIQGNVPSRISKVMHGASGIEFFDADSNGTLDLFWGDLFNPSLYYLKNIGTKFAPNIVLHDSTYPKEDQINTFGFNIPQHVDIEGDGVVDLMIGSVAPNIAIDNFIFYKNVQSNTQPFYVLQTKNFIPMIDAGSRSSVTAADFDGDGDIDLCTSSAKENINLYQNIGSSSHPAYSAQPSFSFLISNNYYLTVSSADINSDNKPDIITGNYDGNIKIFINTSTNGVISFQETLHPLNTVNVGQSSAPFVADIDNDGLVDMLVGNYLGQLLFLKNTGTNTTPIYQSTPFFNSIDVGNDAIPFVGDIDGDSILDLLIGNSEGTINHYKRTSIASAKFELVSKSFQSMNLRTQSSPFMSDLDSDGDKDLLLGNGKGGVLFYENNTVTSSGNNVNAIPIDFKLFQNYPNPFNPSTIINYQLPVAGYVTLKVYDAIGREVTTLVNEVKQAGYYSAKFDGNRLSNGIYFYTLRSGTFTETKKLVLMK